MKSQESSLHSQHVRFCNRNKIKYNKITKWKTINTLYKRLNYPTRAGRTAGECTGNRIAMLKFSVDCVDWLVIFLKSSSRAPDSWIDCWWRSPYEYTCGGLLAVSKNFKSVLLLFFSKSDKLNMIVYWVLSLIFFNFISILSITTNYISFFKFKI